MDTEEFFLKHARVARGAAARFAGIDREEVDEAAEELGFGARLTLRQFEELLDSLDDGDEDETDEDEDETDEGENEELEEAP